MEDEYGTLVGEQAERNGGEYHNLHAVTGIFLTFKEDNEWAFLYRCMN